MTRAEKALLKKEVVEKIKQTQFYNETVEKVKDKRNVSAPMYG